jgi:hypothetical protein
LRDFTSSLLLLNMSMNSLPDFSSNAGNISLKPMPPSSMMEESR